MWVQANSNALSIVYWIRKSFCNSSVQITGTSEFVRNPNGPSHWPQCPLEWLGESCHRRQESWALGFVNWIVVALSFVMIGIPSILFFAYCGYAGYQFLLSQQATSNATGTLGL